MQEQEKFLSKGHRSTFLGEKHNVPFGIGHHPHLHIEPSLCVQEGLGVPNLQTELNYLDSFKSYCDSSDLGFLSSEGWGRWVGGIWGEQL